MKTTDEIRADLLGMQDLPFRDFQSALMPSVPKELVIGVRMPGHARLRKGAGA